MGKYRSSSHISMRKKHLSGQHINFLGAMLQLARDRLMLTQEELASRVRDGGYKTDQTTISSYEKGTRTPSKEVLIVLHEQLCKPVELGEIVECYRNVDNDYWQRLISSPDRVKLQWDTDLVGSFEALNRSYRELGRDERLRLEEDMQKLSEKYKNRQGSGDNDKR